MEDSIDSHYRINIVGQMNNKGPILENLIVQIDEIIVRIYCYTYIVNRSVDVYL